MGDLVALEGGRKINPLPDDLPGVLRELAARVERGEIDSMILAYYPVDGSPEFLWPSSPFDSLVLTAMAQQTAVDRLRR